jgi:hypothetical protein
VLSAERIHEILLVFLYCEFMFFFALFYGLSVTMKWDVMISCFFISLRFLMHAES